MCEGKRSGFYILLNGTKGKIQYGGGKEVTREIGVREGVRDHYVS